jgi:hypothetical protein
MPVQIEDRGAIGSSAGRHVSYAAAGAVWMLLGLSAFHCPVV